MKSNWFRQDRGRVAFDLDRFNDDMGMHPLWDSTERPPDPKGAMVRRYLDTMRENHRVALEDFHFVGKSMEEMAEERGCTRQAVADLLRRAERNFVLALDRTAALVRATPLTAEEL